MKQVSQPIHGGPPRVVEAPAPGLRPGGILVRTAWSLVSPGTERMVVGLAGKSLAGKARSRPDQVRRVLRKLRADGVGATLDAVRARLAGELPLGYSAAGRIVMVSPEVTDLRPGQAVACAGMGYASHAELISVPRHLAAPVPRGLDLRSAATATLGAIALQGVRRADVRLGERVGVVGLGILGLVTVQLLRSAGCHVLAVDLDPGKVGLARTLGAELALVRDDPALEEKARAFGAGHGLDAVVVAAASESSDPAVLGAGMCRLGGRLVIVGAVGMDLPRRLLYDRELTVCLARSYGPGRYDPGYEERGIDYPYPFVRFTEGRNLEEYLALLGRGEVDVEPLLTHEFGIDEGGRAYRFLMSEAGHSAVGLLFRFPAPPEGEPLAPEEGRTVRLLRRAEPSRGVGTALVGAGSFARGVLLPALRRLPACRLTGVVTRTGLSALNSGRTFGFEYATTRFEEVLADEGTEAVVIATRHGEHAALAEAALRAGKDVFLEKPLALDLGELERLTAATADTGRVLMTGFNRRFAPGYRSLRALFAERAAPLHMVYRVSAGALPPDHWARDPGEGGGRVAGEGCHFVDLLLHLAGGPPVRVFAEAVPEQGVTATLRFADGSVGTVIYATAGDAAAGKERLEVHGAGVTAELTDFRTLAVAAGGRTRRRRTGPGRGHREEMRAFLDAVREGRPSPVPFSQAAWSTRATMGILSSAGSGRPVVFREG